MSCPSADQLAALDALDKAERLAIIDHAASCESCRTVVSSVLGTRAPSDEPDLIDRYRIERRLGAGAMGVVYVAYDAELDRRIAVKLMRHGASSERLRREAQVLAKLAHPNVVAVHDVGVHDGQAFVAMALVEGENLRRWLETPRPIATILDALSQAARGIVAAHAAGIVHRDLKPDNIFVGSHGEVLVGDFGLARAESTRGQPVEPTTLTQTGTVLGTPVYMALEAFDGTATRASDQFSLCVTAWEALYGSRPFAGSTIDALIAQMRAGPPSPPDRRVPAHVQAAIRRGLAVDPADRFPSVAALLAAWSRRPRRWPYVAMPVVAVAAGGAMFATRGSEEVPAICVDDLGWTAPRSAALHGTLATSLRDRGAPIATTVDCFAKHWRALAERSCPSPAIAACLTRRAATFETVTTKLLEVNLPINGRVLIDSLGEPDGCRAATLVGPVTPARVAFERELEARALQLSIPATLEPVVIDGSLVERAEVFGDPALTAEAAQLVGTYLTQHARAAEAEPMFRKALALSDRAGDDVGRARAGASLAIALTTSGKLTEARAQRDSATTAAVRADDVRAKIMVERANVEIAVHGNDLAARLAAFRAISRLTGVCGPTLDASRAEIEIAVDLAHRNAPNAEAELAHARGELEGYLQPEVPGAQLGLLAQRGLTEPTRGKRIELMQQLVDQFPPSHVAYARFATSLAFDYLLAGDAVMAYRTRVLVIASLEARAERDRDDTMLAEALVDAAWSALDVAEHSEGDQTPYLTAALDLLDRRERFANARTEIDPLRGQALLALGRVKEALPLLERGIAIAEAETSPIANKIANRSFLLAQALWSGDRRDRDRAKALASYAREQFAKAHALYLSDLHNYAAADSTLQRRLARLEAWTTARF